MGSTAIPRNLPIRWRDKGEPYAGTESVPGKRPATSVTFGVLHLRALGPLRLRMSRPVLRPVREHVRPRLPARRGRPRALGLPKLHIRCGGAAQPRLRVPRLERAPQKQTANPAVAQRRRVPVNGPAAGRGTGGAGADPDRPEFRPGGRGPGWLLGRPRLRRRDPHRVRRSEPLALGPSSVAVARASLKRHDAVGSTIVSPSNAARWNPRSRVNNRSAWTSACAPTRKSATTRSRGPPRPR